MSIGCWKNNNHMRFGSWNNTDRASPIQPGWYPSRGWGYPYTPSLRRYMSWIAVIFGLSCLGLVWVYSYKKRKILKPAGSLPALWVSCLTKDLRKTITSTLGILEILGKVPHVTQIWATLDSMTPADLSHNYISMLELKTSPKPAAGASPGGQSSNSPLQQGLSSGRAFQYIQWDKWLAS